MKICIECLSILSDMEDHPNPESMQEWVESGNHICGIRLLKSGETMPKPDITMNIIRPQNGTMLQVELVRGTKRPIGHCVFCTKETPRVIGCKVVNTEIEYRFVYICDWCIQGIQGMKSDFLGL